MAATAVRAEASVMGVAECTVMVRAAVSPVLENNSFWFKSRYHMHFQRNYVGWPILA